MNTIFKIRVTGFDGRSRNVGKGELSSVIYDDWEAFFKNVGDMSIIFKNMEPFIEDAARDVFNLGYASDKDFGYWTSRWRASVGADPEGENLLATGRLMNSFKRLSSRSGKEKTLSYGFTAPYAEEILTPHTWTFNVGMNDAGEQDYDETGEIQKTIKVQGRDYLTPVYEMVSQYIMRNALEMKWKDIKKVLEKSRGK